MPRPSDAAPAPVFSAHNIRLDDGSETKPDQGFLMADDEWCSSALRLVRALYPRGLRGVRIADLGCLEGGFSVAFARAGMRTLGLEVRESNYRKCLYVKDRVRLPNLRFVNDDAWNLGRHGRFDVIFCCGLLYHLDRPVEFIRMLSGLCDKALILNTHFATARANPHYPLGELTENEGARGRWFHEYDPAQVASTEALEAMNWASWSNSRSFWLERDYLLDAIQQAGFDLVFEQFDGVRGVIDGRHGHLYESMRTGYYATHDRGTFVGVKVK
jgi:hypothetical protein